MSEPSSNPPAPTSPTRPTHRIHRSITEISPPTLKSNPRSHHLRNTSHHHHYHNSRRTRSNDKESAATQTQIQTPPKESQSAHPNLRAGTEPKWRDGVKSEFGTPAESRRASATWDTEFPNWNANAVGLVERRFIKEGEVKEERERGRLRATELRTSLINLNTLSNDQTRRLDNTYYSILEKLSFLQSSLSTLKTTATTTRNTTTDFDSESSSLIEEITSSIAIFSDFSSQESRIKDLSSRVQTGRAKIANLNERVDGVRRKVEGYEFAEGEWQDKTRKRLRVMWIVMSVITVVVIGLVLFRYTPAKPFGPGAVHGIDASELRARMMGEEGVNGNESWSLRRDGEMAREKGEGMLERLKRTQNENRNGERDGGGVDERLRVFDEL